MPLFLDALNGPDGPLTETGAGVPYEVVAGSWRRAGGKAVSDSGRDSRPIIVLPASGVGDFDLTLDISPGGGDAIYARVGDADDWLCARLRRYSETVSGGYYFTEYAWGREVQSGSPPVTEYEWLTRYTTAGDHNGDDLFGLHVEERWLTSVATGPVTSNTMTHTHSTYSPNGDQQPHSHSKVSQFRSGAQRTKAGTGYTTTTEGAWSSSSTVSPWAGTSNPGYFTGTTRQRYQSSSVTTTYVQTIVERSLGGNVQPVASTTRQAVTGTAGPGRLRFRGVGTALTLYVAGSSTPALTANETAHVGNRRHGFGRGPSELSGTALDNLALDTLNTPPNPPTLTYPVGEVVVDRTRPLTLTHKHNDADQGDGQRSHVLFVREANSGDPWVEFARTGALEATTLPAGTLTDDATYEWQIVTVDRSGEPSPPSTSAFFVTATPPPGPIIETPTAGETIGTSRQIVRWLAPFGQDAYRVRKLADDGAGNPTTEELFATGLVESPTTNTYTLDYPENLRGEHVQVQIVRDTLESPWTSVYVLVDYTAPAKPTLALLADDARGRIAVVLFHPTPTGTQPTITDSDVWRREAGDTGDGIPKAAGITAPLWVDVDPGDGPDYEYRVKTRGNNGTSVWSDWQRTGERLGEAVTGYPSSFLYPSTTTYPSSGG